jgi:hypothetical protein
LWETPCERYAVATPFVAFGAVEFDPQRDD